MDLRSLTGGSGNFVNNVTKRKGNLALVENINFVVFDLNQLGFEPMIYHSNSRKITFSLRDIVYKIPASTRQTTQISFPARARIK
jgi:competence protein ComGF